MDVKEHEFTELNTTEKPDEESISGVPLTASAPDVAVNTITNTPNIVHGDHTTETFKKTVTKHGSIEEGNGKSPSPQQVCPLATNNFCSFGNWQMAFLKFQILSCCIVAAEFSTFNVFFMFCVCRFRTILDWNWDWSSFPYLCYTPGCVSYDRLLEIQVTFNTGQIWCYEIVSNIKLRGKNANAWFQSKVCHCGLYFRISVCAHLCALCRPFIP